MMKVIIQEKFNTRMGLILKVKNDRLFKINDVIETKEERYTIKRITFSTIPTNDEFVYLIVDRCSQKTVKKINK